MILNPEILKKAVISCRKEGFGKSLAKIMYSIITPVVTIRIVYKSDLNQTRFPSENEDFTIEKMNLHDLDLMYSTNEHEVPPSRYEYLKEMIKSSTSSCYMLKNNAGDICGYCGIEFAKGRHAKILGKIKHIDTDKSGYTTRDYTFKKFRGQGVHKFGICRRCLILQNKGYETAITRVAKNNVIPQHNYEKVGFRKILIEIHFHLFNRFPSSNYLVIPLSHN